MHKTSGHIIYHETSDKLTSSRRTDRVQFLIQLRGLSVIDTIRLDESSEISKDDFRFKEIITRYDVVLTSLSFRSWTPSLTIFFCKDMTILNIDDDLRALTIHARFVIFWKVDELWRESSWQTHRTPEISFGRTRGIVLRNTCLRSVVRNVASQVRPMIELESIIHSTRTLKSYRRHVSNLRSIIVSYCWRRGHVRSRVARCHTLRNDERRRSRRILTLHLLVLWPFVEQFAWRREICNTQNSTRRRKSKEKNVCHVRTRIVRDVIFTCETSVASDTIFVFLNDIIAICDQLLVVAIY